MYTDRSTFLVKIGDGPAQHLNKEAQPVSLTTIVVHIDDHGLGRHTLHSPGMKQDVTNQYLWLPASMQTQTPGAHIDALTNLQTPFKQRKWATGWRLTGTLC